MKLSYLFVSCLILHAGSTSGLVADGDITDTESEDGDISTIVGIKSDVISSVGAAHASEPRIELSKDALQSSAVDKDHVRVRASLRNPSSLLDTEPVHVVSPLHIAQPVPVAPIPATPMVPKKSIFSYLGNVLNFFKRSPPIKIESASERVDRVMQMEEHTASWKSSLGEVYIQKLFALMYASSMKPDMMDRIDRDYPNGIGLDDDTVAAIANAIVQKHAIGICMGFFIQEIKTTLIAATKVCTEPSEGAGDLLLGYVMDGLNNHHGINVIAVKLFIAQESVEGSEFKRLIEKPDRPDEIPEDKDWPPQKYNEYKQLNGVEIQDTLGVAPLIDSMKVCVGILVSARMVYPEAVRVCQHDRASLLHVPRIVEDTARFDQGAINREVASLGQQERIPEHVSVSEHLREQVDLPDASSALPVWHSHAVMLPMRLMLRSIDAVKTSTSGLVTVGFVDRFIRMDGGELLVRKYKEYAENTPDNVVRALTPVIRSAAETVCVGLMGELEFPHSKIREVCDFSVTENQGFEYMRVNVYALLRGEDGFSMKGLKETADIVIKELGPENELAVWKSFKSQVRLGA
jgi:hypothetical protein